MPDQVIQEDAHLRRVVRIVALLNLGYFALEFAVARTVGSVSLFADSVDFLEVSVVRTFGTTGGVN